MTAFASRHPIDIDSYLEGRTSLYASQNLDRKASIYTNSVLLPNTSANKTTILSLTGSGYVSFLSIASVATLPDHINIDIVVDGISWIDNQRLFTNPGDTNKYSQIIGCLRAAFEIIGNYERRLSMDPVYFSSSFLVRGWTSVGNDTTIDYWTSYEVMT